MDRLLRNPPGPSSWRASLAQLSLSWPLLWYCRTNWFESCQTPRQQKRTYSTRQSPSSLLASLWPSATARPNSWRAPTSHSALGPHVDLHRVYGSQGRLRRNHRPLLRSADIRNKLEGPGLVLENFQKQLLHVPPVNSLRMRPQLAYGEPTNTFHLAKLSRLLQASLQICQVPFRVKV
jgi:hypothetical protein